MPKIHPRLNPAFLLASTINEAGNIELPDPEHEGAERLEYCLHGDGTFVQRRGGVAEPPNMLLLGAALTLVFGERTPVPFLVEEAHEGRLRRLVQPGVEGDGLRIRLLQDAFNLYLTAYEEGLV